MLPGRFSPRVLACPNKEREDALNSALFPSLFTGRRQIAPNSTGNFRAICSTALLSIFVCCVFFRNFFKGVDYDERKICRIGNGMETVYLFTLWDSKDCKMGIEFLEALSREENLKERDYHLEIAYPVKPKTSPKTFQGEGAVKSVSKNGKAARRRTKTR